MNTDLTAQITAATDRAATWYKALKAARQQPTGLGTQAIENALNDALAWKADLLALATR